MTPGSSAALRALRRDRERRARTARRPRAMADSPLTPEEYAVYSVLFDEGPHAPTELARRAGMPPTSMSHFVRGMLERGHAERAPVAGRPALLPHRPDAGRASPPMAAATPRCSRRPTAVHPRPGASTRRRPRGPSGDRRGRPPLARERLAQRFAADGVRVADDAANCAGFCPACSSSSLAVGLWHGRVRHVAGDGETSVARLRPARRLARPRRRCHADPTPALDRTAGWRADIEPSSMPAITSTRTAGTG